MKDKLISNAIRLERPENIVSVQGLASVARCLCINGQMGT